MEEAVACFTDGPTMPASTTVAFIAAADYRCDRMDGLVERGRIKNVHGGVDYESCRDCV